MKKRKPIVGMAIVALLLASAAARAESTVAEENAATAVAMSESGVARTHNDRHATPTSTRDERAQEPRRVALNTPMTQAARPSSAPALVDPRDCSAVLQRHAVFIPPTF